MPEEKREALNVQELWDRMEADREFIHNYFELVWNGFYITLLFIVLLLWILDSLQMI
mgnify:CR=1 FL=1